jgi:4-methyl-5(b-hydroxyethyl)-thiazole monophosphate biosynthesis
VEADLMFETADVEDADLLMLPGGMPGASNLNDHEGVKEALLAQAQAGKLTTVQVELLERVHGRTSLSSP